MNRAELQQELSDLAILLKVADQDFEEGRYLKAAVTYKEALEILERSFGELDPDAIMCVQRLADSYTAAGQHQDALPLYKRLLTLGESILGAQHPDVLAMAAKVNGTSGKLDTGESLPEMKKGAARVTYSSLAALKPEHIKPDEWVLDWELYPVVDAPDSPLDSGSSAWQGGAGSSWHVNEQPADWSAELPVPQWNKESPGPAPNPAPVRPASADNAPDTAAPRLKAAGGEYGQRFMRSSSSRSVSTSLPKKNDAGGANPTAASATAATPASTPPTPPTLTPLAEGSAPGRGHETSSSLPMGFGHASANRIAPATQSSPPIDARSPGPEPNSFRGTVPTPPSPKSVQPVSKPQSESAFSAQPSSMKHSSPETPALARSNIKPSRDGAAADKVAKARSEKNSSLGNLSLWFKTNKALLKTVKTMMMMALPCVLVLVLLIGGGIFYSKIVEKKEDSSTDIVAETSATTAAGKQQYATADGAIQIEIDPEQNSPSARMKVLGHTLPATLPLVHVGPNFLQILNNALSCLSHKDTWFEEVPEGIRDEAGVYYYGKNSPESTILAQMKRIAGDANRFYREGKGGYPTKSNFVFSYAYMNPFTGESFLPFLTLQHLNSEDAREILAEPKQGDPDLLKSLQKPASAKWAMEPILSPGAIHCLTVRRDYQNPASYDFYSHCCDRHGKLICGGDAGKIFVIGFHNGHALTTTHSYPLPVSKSRSVRFCLVKVPPGFSLRMTRALCPLVLIVCGLLITLGTHLAKSRSERGLIFGVGDLCSLIFIVLGIFWGYFMLFAS
jgi:hypothetical protein